MRAWIQVDFEQQLLCSPVKPKQSNSLVVSKLRFLVGGHEKQASKADKVARLMSLGKDFSHRVLKTTGMCPYASTGSIFQMKFPIYHYRDVS